MGCDGNTPNVICPSRISPSVNPWLAGLPTPSSAGPTNNYLGNAIPDTILGNTSYYMGRYDLQIGNKDHAFLASGIRRRGEVPLQLPQPIASETLLRSPELLGQPLQLRPGLLQHAAESHVDGLSESQRGIRLCEQPVLRGLPKIAGVASSDLAPQYQFSDGFATLGCNAGIPDTNITTRPTFIINDMVTWEKRSTR